MLYEVITRSPQELGDILLRLDHNIFRATVPRGFSVPAETTDGMIVTRLAVNGRQVDLDAPPTPGRGRQGTAPQLGTAGMDQTLARVV